MGIIFDVAIIVHEIETIKLVFGSARWAKYNKDFLEKYDELFELVAFGQKLRYFTDQNGPHENEF